MSVEAAIPEETFDSLNAFVSNLEKSIGKSLDPLNEVAKKMSSSKFGKNAKSFGNAMKGMAASSIQAWKMEQIMKLIEPFMKLLKLLELPITVLSALLTMMVNEVFVELLPYMIQFAMEMLRWAPIFVWVGKALAFLMDLQIRWGQFMKGVFIEGLTIVYLFLKDKFLPIWEKIKAFFVGFGVFLGQIFQPFWNALKASFTILKKAWEDSGGKVFGKTGFIANAFRGVMNIVKLIVNGVIGSINLLITQFNKIPGVSIGAIPLLANGGIVTGGPQLAMLGDNRSGTEAVVPLERSGEFGFGNKETISLLEDQNVLLRRLLRQSQEDSKWRL